MSHAVRSHGFTALGPLHEAFARLTGWPAVITSLLLGAFSAVAFAPFHFSAVLVISFTGLIWMLDGARGHRRWGRAVFLRTWAFGTGFFLISMHWTAAPFLVEPEKHAIFCQFIDVWSLRGRWLVNVITFHILPTEIVCQKKHNVWTIWPVIRR